MSTNPTLDQLEQAASEVIAILKTFPEFTSAKILIIGGMALWKHIKNYRTTQDVDFLITVTNAPKAVREKLLNMIDSKFQDFAGTFMYQSSSGSSIQVDMVPDYQSPYVPDSATSISSLSATSALPYISIQDLIVFTVHSCGLRPNGQKKRRDALDAVALNEKTPNLQLTAAQKKWVREGLDDAIENSRNDEAWWRARLLP